jgi:hypothetical protein
MFWINGLKIKPISGAEIYTIITVLVSLILLIAYLVI